VWQYEWKGWCQMIPQGWCNFNPKANINMKEEEEIGCDIKGNYSSYYGWTIKKN
jgi:hypothetical protein